MKAYKLLTFFLFATWTFVACDDSMDEFSPYQPAKVGEEIKFGGVANFNNPKTRTVYGDENADHSATEIKWYEGDMVRIYCAQARDVAGNPYCDYAVQDYVQKPIYENGVLANGQYAQPTDGTYEASDNATLLRAATEPYGLQWGSEGTHTFYGVYPSPDMFEAGSSVVKSYSFDSNTNTFSGYLPSAQAPTSYLAGVVNSTTGATTYTIQPAMRFAYMMAKGTATPAQGGCNLTFSPIVTAVEFTLVNTNSANPEKTLPIEDISLVSVSSTNNNVYLCGEFTAAINDNITTKIVSGKGEKAISITVQDENGNPISLKANDVLKFTVFMLPNNGEEDVDLNSLRLTIQSGLTFKNCTISGSNNGIIVNAKKKNFIAGINLGWNVQQNQQQTVSSANWVEVLSDEFLMGNLSLIGAGGVGSHDMAEGYNQQTLDVEALWNRGVRCFEIFTDRAGSTGSSLGDQYLVCNGVKSTTTKLNDVVTKIQEMIEANPKEFAIVILGYYPVESRDAKLWQSPLKKYWENTVNKWNKTTSVQDANGNYIVCKTAEYRPNLTLGECRGKLFCLSRPTTIGRDQWWYSSYDVAKNVVPVLGWGPSPDAWYARGYTRTTRPYYINKTGNFDGFDTETTTNGGGNYMYPSYQNVLEASENGTLISNTSSNKGETSSAFVAHLTFDHGSTFNDKFMYRVGSDKLYDGKTAHTYTKLVDYNTLRVYAQDWRRVSKGTINGVNLGGEAPQSYVAYINPTLDLGKNIESIQSVTLEKDGVTYELEEKSGLYEFDFVNKYEKTFVININYRYRNNWLSSYTNETAKIEITGGIENSTLYTINVYSSTNVDVVSSDYAASQAQPNFYYYWPSSIAEKKNDILTALNRSCNAEDRAYTIYVNSLCGFYIDSRYEKSYKPDPMRLAFIPQSSTTSSNYTFNDTKYNGTAVNGVSYEDYYTSDSNPVAYDMTGGTQGNIVDYAKEMNDFFYQELLKIGANNLAGPTGIIMMDRVSNDKENNPAGYYLPQIIVSNNFKWNGTGGGFDFTLGDEEVEATSLAPKQKTMVTEGGLNICWDNVNE